MNKYEIVEKMKVHEQNNSVQLIQTEHRIHLVNEMGIEEGMRVLEIGCGQGDTTAVLATKVGITGYVKAIDIADGQYGAPITLKEATDHLKTSDLGDIIDFHFATDFLQFEMAEHFDVVVFSLCSWYMESVEMLEKSIRKAATIAKKIIIADWDLIDVNANQIAHQQAAIIQALYATSNKSDANIKTIFTRQQIELLLLNCQLQIEKSVSVDASYLQDGQWEVEYALTLAFPEALTSLVQTLKELITTKRNDQYSMNQFLIVAATN